MPVGSVVRRVWLQGNPFGPSFKSFGVIFDVGGIPDGSFSFQHTESRKSELVQMLDTLMNAQRSTPKELERLHGRLIWFSAFVFGRMMNQLVKAVSQECLKRTSSEFLHTLNDLKAASHVVKARGDFQILVHHSVCLYRRGVRT